MVTDYLSKRTFRTLVFAADDSMATVVIDKPGLEALVAEGNAPT